MIKNTNHFVIAKLGMLYTCFEELPSQPVALEPNTEEDQYLKKNDCIQAVLKTMKHKMSMTNDAISYNLLIVRFEHITIKITKTWS